MSKLLTRAIFVFEARALIHIDVGDVVGARVVIVAMSMASAVRLRWRNQLCRVDDDDATCE